ncbi:MAG: RNA 3'-terminal phosphate cyclase [Promethearchaeota archaeon]|jgi:RNA 3'-terminal phosphate cyclase (ATP)
MMRKHRLEIDGSFGEGGGSILRLAAAFSQLYNYPIKIKNIRANRPKPGLRTQHLIGLKVLSDLTGSTLSECRVGTEELTFTPNPKSNLNTQLEVNVNTAASIGLLLQPIQVASFELKGVDKIEIDLNGGGSFGKWAPSLNYLQEVTYKIFKNSGIKIEFEILKHGFYPKGGAQTRCTIYPSKTKLKPISLTELGTITLMQGKIFISNQLKRNRDHIGTRIKGSILQHLKRTLKIETDITFEWVESASPGIGLSLWSHSDTGAVISTGTILGEKKLPSEKLGRIAAEMMIKYVDNNIPVDDHLSDQLIPLMAFIQEPSKIRVLKVTGHAQTNLDLIKLFNPRNFAITKENNGYTIEYI